MLNDVRQFILVVLGRWGILPVTCLLLLLSACTKENDQAQWDVDLLLPLVNSTLTVDDLVADSLQTSGPNNGIIIVYEEELFALALDTILSIPDTSFSYPYALPFAGPVTVTGGTTVLSTQDESRFGLDPIELSEVLVRSGEIQLTARSKVNTPTVADLVLTSATAGGSNLALQLNIPEGTVADPTFVTLTTPVDGYHFDLRGPLFNAVNTLTNTIVLATAVGAPDVSVTDQDSLIATVTYKDVVPQYARGFFGVQQESFNESIAVNVFDNLSGTLDLDQVTVRMRITNGIGVDAQLFINTLNSVGQSTIGLNHQILSGPINITRGTDLGGTGFIPSFQEIELNNSNSNIDLFFENLPQEFEFAADMDINPLGNISNGNDFLYFDSELSVDLSTEIPLNLLADDLAIATTAEIDLPGSTDGHGIQSGTLKLFAVNGFPLDGSISFEIFENQGTTFSIPVSGTMAAATVDATGNVIAPTESQLEIVLTEADVNRLYETQKVRIVATFNTVPVGQQVRILDTHQLALQLTADFNYTVNEDQ